MRSLVARLIAYVFLGSFCIAGPLLLVVALGAAMQRTALLYSGLRAEGTVIAKRQTGSSRVTYAPVFQFTTNDGRTFVANSDVYGRESAYRFGEHVPVLYRQGHPESARIDAFAELWTLPLVTGVVGAGFSIIPAIVLMSWLRRRRTSGTQPDSEREYLATEAVSPGVRRAIGVLLTGGGLVLLAFGLGTEGSRVVVVSLGVLLASSGVAVGQWVSAGSRLYHALGGAAVTSMAVVFGWVSLYGDSAGFSSGVGIGGATMRSSGSATGARIAFGMASIVLGLASLWAWKQVLRRDP